MWTFWEVFLGPFTPLIWDVKGRRGQNEIPTALKVINSKQLVDKFNTTN